LKFLDEYRDAERARTLLGQIERVAHHPWQIMEVCGGQTHGLLKHGIDRLLPAGVTLLHGPGCPVCVTPLEVIDRALELAARPEVTFCSFGDMLRVPGSHTDLRAVRASGGDIRIVYSPLDAVELARQNPDREVVFFAVGFETTAPANAMAVLAAARAQLSNFTILASHARVPPALEALLSAPDNRIQGFLAAGHVCTVMGVEEYGPIAERFGVPIVVTGFEPIDLLSGILTLIEELEAGRARVLNAYARIARDDGNMPARRVLEDVFTVSDRPWRGLGVIPSGALTLSERYREFDADQRFPRLAPPSQESDRCRSGEVLRGVLRPDECPEFGASCTPDHPLGATMVSAEGACSAYWRYRGVAPTATQAGKR